MSQNKAEMISVEEALDKILSNVKVLPAETVPILNSQGQVLTSDVIADFDIPTLDNSAMDGYAVRSADIKEASKQSPRILKVIDTLIAGMVPKQAVTPVTAIRIMTGAPVPGGADCIIRFEDTDKQDQNKEEVRIFIEATAGTNVRKKGDDISKGSTVIPGSTVIKPAHIGMLASLGKSAVSVIRRPRVAVLATGNELVEIGKPLTPGKQYSSNTYTIAALVVKYGGIPDVLSIAGDNEDSIVSQIRRGLLADILITTGGVSEGDYDMVKDLLVKRGRLIFHKVRFRPGKPLAFGILTSSKREVPHFGLPGNPVSAMVTFEVFVRPAILKMSGRTRLERTIFKAVSEDMIKNNDGRRVYARAIIERRDDNYFARTTGPQGSHILTSMSLANGLVIVPEDRTVVKPGDVVDFIMLEDNGEAF
jgi:molybdopterin molybdotransferase